MKKWKLVAIAAGVGLTTIGGLASTAALATSGNDRTAAASSGVANFMTGYNALCSLVGTNGSGDAARIAAAQAAVCSNTQ